MFQLFRRKSKPAPKIAPDTAGRTVYAIGDVHGRLDLLDELLGLIENDAQGRPEPTLVFLGDYIDRGPDSRGVIERIIELTAQGRYRVVSLMGNHERALLDFLSDPVPRRAWLDYGGKETLESYGVAPVLSQAADDELIDCAAKMESRIAPRLDFLRQLRMHEIIGNHLFVHAGVKPGVPIDQQDHRDLLWIRAAFLEAETHGLPYVVVHGHTPMPTVEVRPERVSLDTGAYASGVLSAARLDGGEVEVLGTKPH